MPTYEYECKKCGKRFDCLQSISAKPLTRCIHCKGKVSRLIGGGAGLIFKGSGFYITDYKKSSGSSSSSKSASDSKKSSPKSDTKD